MQLLDGLILQAVSGLAEKLVFLFGGRYQQADPDPEKNRNRACCERVVRDVCTGRANRGLRGVFGLTAERRRLVTDRVGNIAGFRADRVRKSACLIAHRGGDAARFVADCPGQVACMAGD